MASVKECVLANGFVLMTEDELYTVNGGRRQGNQHSKDKDFKVDISIHGGNVDIDIHIDTDKGKGKDKSKSDSSSSGSSGYHSSHWGRHDDR